jgi:hypothetical protein
LNWWGTVKACNIAARIVVADEDPPGCGTVIFEPFLAGAPSGTSPYEPGAGTDDEKVVSAAYLGSNYPNPFNPSTTIAFGLVKASPVNLGIYDASGRLVRILADRSFPAGQHALTWNGVDGRGHAVASGVYFYRLVAGDFRETKKMILLR